MDSNSEPPSHSEPLPATGISEILGLLELLKHKGGKEDIYKLAAELKMEFGDTLTVIRGAEMLGLVHTPTGDVVLEALGKKVTQSKISQKKTLLKSQMEKLPVFGRVVEFLKEKEDHHATRDQVLEKLAELIPNEHADQSFFTLINWGRYAELFGYNDDRQTFYLDQESQPSTASGRS